MHHVQGILKRIDESIFGHPGNDFISKAFLTAFIVLLFIAGVIHWVFFFNHGEMLFDNCDWPREFMQHSSDWPRHFMNHSILRQSLQDHVIPYHFSDPTHRTTRFLAVPEIPLSPQIILLPLMSIGKFVMVNTLILYTLGFAGCLLIKKKYRLSFLPFLILFLLFNFNGHITSHIGIGHIIWNGYFLLPFFCIFVLELIENKTSVITPIKLSFVLLAIFLQGAFHIYTWCLMFMLALAISNRQHLKGGLLTILFTLVLSTCRTLPAATTFQYWGGETPFKSGYPTFSDLFAGLTTIRPPTYKEIGGVFGTLGWWEYDIYVSIIGLAVIIYFGIWLRFSRKAAVKNYRYQALDIPILLMVLFSLGNCYALIANLPIPFVSSERVSARFMIIPVLFLLVVSSIRMQQLLPEFRNLKFKLLSIFGVIQMAFLLGIHSSVWEISRIEEMSRARVVHFPIDIINQQDTLYKMSVKVSAVVSLIAVIVLVYLWQIIRKKET